VVRAGRRSPLTTARSGLAYLWTFSQHGARAVQNVIAGLAEVAVGEHPFFTTRLWRGMWARITQWGHKGLSLIGMTGIDIALWDIVGKALGEPLAHVHGANVNPVRTYASEGLWLTDDLTALASEADEIPSQWFRAIKMRLGRARIVDDLEAVRVVRQTIGSDVRLMVDSNRGWDVDYAIRIGRKLAQFDLAFDELDAARRPGRPHADCGRAGHAAGLGRATGHRVPATSSSNARARCSQG
jgi:L-alanine-DL-glutamate epimerase-like enolase superfamily enzyme